jgi:hypothetical protein
MRKLFWCCAAVVAAGSVWAVCHAYRRPGSLVARCVGAGHGCGVAAVAGAAAGATPAPTPRADAETTAQAAVIDVPSLAAAPIVIDEDVKPAGADGTQPAIDQEELLRMLRPLALVPTQGPCVGACGVPDPMSTCVAPEGDRPPEPMPPAEGAAADGDKAGCADALGFLMKVFFPKKTVEPALPTGATDGGPSEPMGPPQGVEDSNYHRTFPGCPYTGPCPGMYRSCPTPPVPHETQKPAWHEDVTPHTDIDTMEFRPSDHGLNEYGTGGPF